MFDRAISPSRTAELRLYACTSQPMTELGLPCAVLQPGIGCAGGADGVATKVGKLLSALDAATLRLFSRKGRLRSKRQELQLRFHSCGAICIELS